VGPIFDKVKEESIHLDLSRTDGAIIIIAANFPLSDDCMISPMTPAAGYKYHVSLTRLALFFGLTKRNCTSGSGRLYAS
jgi:hypothetical protein